MSQGLLQLSSLLALFVQWYWYLEGHNSTVHFLLALTAGKEDTV